MAKRKVAVSREGSTVIVEIICPDEYEAAVLEDDIVTRLMSGDGILLSVAAPAQPGVSEAIRGEP